MKRPKKRQTIMRNAWFVRSTLFSLKNQSIITNKKYILLTKITSKNYVRFKYWNCKIKMMGDLPALAFPSIHLSQADSLTKWTFFLLQQLHICHKTIRYPTKKKDAMTIIFFTPTTTTKIRPSNIPGSNLSYELWLDHRLDCREWRFTLYNFFLKNDWA